MDDRRRYPRYEAELEAEYDVDRYIEIQARTRTMNISKGGVAMPLNKAIEPGNRITVKIKLPDREKEVVAFGRVVWKKPALTTLVDEELAGVKFLSIEKEGECALTEYLQSAYGGI